MANIKLLALKYFDKGISQGYQRQTRSEHMNSWEGGHCITHYKVQCTTLCVILVLRTTLHHSTCYAVQGTALCVSVVQQTTLNYTTHYAVQCTTLHISVVQRTKLHTMKCSALHCML